MSRSRSGDSAWEAPVPLWSGFFTRYFTLIIFLALATAALLAVYFYFRPIQGSAAAVSVAGESNTLSAAIIKAVPDRPITQRLAQSPGPLRIGIIAGHLGNDSGTVCDDGLTEVQITQQLAEDVSARLQASGVPTEILAEFDPRLQSYSATALVSIHVDSCQFFNDLATGFKISGSAFTDSSQLSICMEQEYGKATRLPYHVNTVTVEMTDYHAFREIAIGTPAIIIEVGFLNLDRELLTTRQEVPVEGLTNGILCYLSAIGQTEARSQ